MARSRKGVRGKQTRDIAPFLPSLLLFLLACLLYLNTLGHGFVFDDGALILQNPAVTEMRWEQILGAGSYRPVRTLTYALNYALGGDDPIGYHFLNLLLHGLNAVLLFRLLATWLGSLFPAFAGTLIFVVHPAQTAAVAYVSGRKDLLATAFLLLGVSLYCRYRREGRHKWLIASLGAAALAMLSKEVALVFPGVLLLVELLAVNRTDSGAMKVPDLSVVKRLGPALVAAATLALAGIGHALFISQATRMTGYWGDDFLVNLGTSLKLFAHYLKLAVWPHPLLADYTGEVFPLSRGFAEVSTLASGLLLVAFLVGIIWMARKKPLIALGMSWFLLTLLPVLQIIPFHELAADHFLYLPLVGLAVATGQLFAIGSVSENLLARGALALVVLAGCWRTIDRNQDWKDSVTLWEATYRSAPGSFRANNNLGRYYFEMAERRTQGIALARRALELRPDDPVALSNYGVMRYYLAQQAAGRDQFQEAARLALLAREDLRLALEARPWDGTMLTNLGSVERLLGELGERLGRAETGEMRRASIEHFQQALERDSRPQVKAAWYNMALVRIDLREYQLAASHLEEFLKGSPDHPDANWRLAQSRLQLGQVAQAVPALRKLIQVRPSAQAYDLLATAQQRLGNLDEALAVCRRGLQRFPQDQALTRRLAVLEAAG